MTKFAAEVTEQNYFDFKLGHDIMPQLRFATTSYLRQIAHGEETRRSCEARQHSRFRRQSSSAALSAQSQNSILTNICSDLAAICAAESSEKSKSYIHSISEVS